jgi:hypothetical protein
MAMRHSREFEELIATLKLAVAALRDRQVPFMLGGSLAAWARGGPEPRNDLDFMVKPADAETALEALKEAGMRTERPPEEWLYKAYKDGVLIDLIFRPAGVDVTDETLARADVMAVMAVSMPVMALEDVLVTMIFAINEHALDYSRLVAIARSLREQIDWQRLRVRTGGYPYAKAFFTLAQELGLAPGTTGARGASERVRVLPAAER